jgi:hypothetical protein
MSTPVVHNEYFRTVALGGRKSCPSCHSRLERGEQVWSWGEYQRAKWYTVQHFCKQCWMEVENKLSVHAFQCRCTFQLVGYRGERLPDWLCLEAEHCERGSNR